MKEDMARATVFGLDVYSEKPLGYLGPARASRTGRVLDVLVDRAGRTEWPSEAKLISGQERPDGALAIRIEAHPDAGYQLSGPRYGRHLISPDARRLRCIPEQAREADWQRFLVAQVLPFAAALNGLEVLHASGVAFGSRAIALAGPSGAGKTSLALALARLGAAALADDVLALEQREDRVLAHPGAPVAGVALQEARRLEGHRDLQRTLAVDERERVIALRLAGRPVALRAVLFLVPDCNAGGEPEFSIVEGAGALLSCTFNFVLDRPERLARLLDVCALLARGTVARVRFGPALDPDRLALSVVEWFEGLR
jgi:hypothetical protein